MSRDRHEQGLLSLWAGLYLVSIVGFAAGFAAAAIKAYLYL